MARSRTARRTARTAAPTKQPARIAKAAPAKKAPAAPAKLAALQSAHKSVPTAVPGVYVSLPQMAADATPVAPKPAPIDHRNPASPLPADDVLQTWSKRTLREALKVRQGYTAPDSWTVAKLIDALHGKLYPRSAGPKEELVELYTERMGIAPAKGWSCRDIIANLASGKLPGGSAAKAAARSAYTAKMGVAPAKGWTVKKIVANTSSGKLPGRRTAGPTADDCRKLLSDARKAGIEVPAYSKLKADELRSLVARLGL